MQVASAYPAQASAMPMIIRVNNDELRKLSPTALEQFIKQLLRPVEDAHELAYGVGFQLSETPKPGNAIQPLGSRQANHFGIVRRGVRESHGFHRRWNRGMVE